MSSAFAHCTPPTVLAVNVGPRGRTVLISGTQGADPVDLNVALASSQMPIPQRRVPSATAPQQQTVGPSIKAFNGCSTASPGRPGIGKNTSAIAGAPLQSAPL
jgi:hypothetical protein